MSAPSWPGPSEEVLRAAVSRSSRAMHQRGWVANHDGTFAGTLVLQRRDSQRSAGIFNAIGLLIPVLNIAAFLLRHQPETAAAGGFVHLMTLPAVAAAAAPAVM